MIEYVMISAILMSLFIVMMILVNDNFMMGPANTITYSEFTDIGNGVSARIVDTYAIAPDNGNLSSVFDIPDDVAGRSYFVDIEDIGGDRSTESVTVHGNGDSTSIAIAGIGSSLEASGNTTGAGLNQISYDSGGFS